MGLISRLHAFLNGTPNDGSQVSAEFDQVYIEINGNLDNANIATGANIDADKIASIPPAQVLDHADSETEYKTTATPGDTGSPLLPSTLEQEWERMRHRVAANKQYQTSAFYMDGTGPTATTVSWTEPPIVGRNLLPNPGFEAPLVSSTPPGWTLVATPTLAIEVPADPTLGVEKRSLRIATDAINEGISCIVGGLKRNGKYLIGMRYTRTFGTINLTTANALASGDYQNLNLTDGTSSTAEVLQGIVRAENDSTPSPITVSIFCSAANADFNIHDVWMYELSDGAPNDLPSIPTQAATSTTPATLPSAWSGSEVAWRTDTLTSLSLTQYIPWAGYRLRYEVTVPFLVADVSNDRKRGRVYGSIQVNIDSLGANTVSGPVFYETGVSSGDIENSGGTLSLSHTIDNPTPGSTYAFTTLLGVYDDEAYEQISAPPLVSGVQMESRAVLTVERI